jgi:hypothetical protein
MRKDFVDMYEYTRGTEWSIKCILYDTGHITFDVMVAPEGASLELREAFVVEAEHAVRKQKAINNGKQYGGA